ncbi:MAG: phosphoadenosine phosphosulfate reductase family protein [Desulfobacteraceae bacterium]|nr:phosphoadenosine phosphosulfate reductase family protein [Desulfobacteraceae bacterium]
MSAFSELKKRQALPLKEKIQLTQELVSCWNEAFDGDVSVSYSGGNDSTVLLDIARQVNPKIKGVFVNTGLEYPEIVSHVKHTENVVILRPPMAFHQVIAKYGWPLISKKTASNLEYLKNPTPRNENIRRLILEGITRDGHRSNSFKLANRWKFLIQAPFKISDRCCEIIKEGPLNRFHRDSGLFSMSAVMASESKRREAQCLLNGCNAYDLKTPRSWPMAFWNQRDVLEYIHTKRLPYASVYGRIVRIESGYCTTGCERTGCIYCGFGLHMGRVPNRFQLLAVTHPRQWDYVINHLGMRYPLQYIMDHVSPTFKKRFNPFPGQLRIEELIRRKHMELKRMVA